MIKKIVIGVLCTILIFFASVLLFEQFFGKKISQSLSERSKEYIAKKEVSGQGSAFSEVLNKKGKDTRGNRIQVGACFSFITPYKILNERQDADCKGYFGIENPRGSITAYVKEGRVGTFDQMEGVSFRRQNRNYVESQKEINNMNFLFFKNTQEGYQKSAFYFTDGYYFVLTLTANTDENLDESFESIIKSLQFDM